MRLARERELMGGRLAGDVELRVAGERAVLTGTDDGRDVDPDEVGLGAGLAEALHEWARVAAAVRRGRNGAGGEVVSNRGRQLAGRLAAALGTPVRYLDPVTDRALVVPPPMRAAPMRAAPARAAATATTPWGTGLTVAAFFAVVAVVAIVALARTLAQETAGWVAVVATTVVAAGLAPSLWLGRSVPVVRWIVLGVAIGAGLSWTGVLLTMLFG